MRHSARMTSTPEGFCPILTPDDLRDLGVTSVGHRRQLLDAIAGLYAPKSRPPVISRRPGRPTPTEKLISSLRL